LKNHRLCNILNTSTYQEKGEDKMIDEVKEGDVVKDANVVAVFSSFDEQLAKWKKDASTRVFDIHTTKGNRECRSHVHKLRKSKKPISDAHKAAKEASLEYGRKLDREKWRLINELDEVIDIFQGPLDALKEKEDARIAEVARITSMIDYNNYDNNTDSEGLRKNLAGIEAIDINSDVFASDKEEAYAKKATSIEFLTMKIQIAERAEKDEADRVLAEEKAQAEMIEAQRLAEEKATADREKQIAEDARLAAIEEQKQEVENSRLAAEKAERDLIEQKAQAEKQRLAAIEAARIQQEQAVADAKLKSEQEVAAEKQRIAQAKANADQEALTKAADVNHRAKINNEALADIENAGYSNQDAKNLVILVASGKVRHTSVNY
jgi:hypothetical protein